MLRIVTIFALIILPAPARGDDSLVLPTLQGSSGCTLSTFGGKSRAAFDAFDAKLRAAAAGSKPGDFVSLVGLPLAIRRDEREIAIKTGAEVLKQAARIFTKDVRDAILSQTGFFCTSEGLMHGDGKIQIQADGDGYAIRYVNVGTLNPANVPSSTHPEVKFTCVTLEETIQIEHIGDERLRYRSWKKGKSLAGKSDLTLPVREVLYEGAGRCGYSIYVFENGAVTYKVSELACPTGAEPKGAVGKLRVSKAGKTLSDQWCGPTR